MKGRGKGKGKFKGGKSAAAKGRGRRVRPSTKGRTPCRYFPLGQCKAGNKCPHLHIGKARGKGGKKRGAPAVSLAAAYSGAEFEPGEEEVGYMEGWDFVYDDDGTVCWWDDGEDFELDLSDYPEGPDAELFPADP